MSLTRTKLLVCKVRDCEFSEEVHERGSWCRLIQDVEHSEGFTHQHWPKRSQGGRKIVALLCGNCHMRIDNGDWSNRVIDGTYLIYDHGFNILLAHREGMEPGTGALEGSGSAETAGPVPGSVPSDIKAWMDAVPEELTRSECIAIAQQLRAERERNPWMTGDLLNAAERLDDTDNSWADNGDSLLDILKLQPETASNYQRVAAAYSTTERVLGLSFGHHQSCYRLPDRDSWLKLAVDEGLSVSELRRRIKPPQPKPKRWTHADLVEQAVAWAMTPCANDGHIDNSVVCFLDWLGGETA